MPIEPIKIDFKKDDKGKYFFINHEVMKLMQLMAEHRFVSSAEVIKILGYKMKAWRKINDLQSSELINVFETMPSIYNGIYWNVRMARKAFSLTRSGYQLLEKERHLRVFRRFYPSHYKISSLPHTTASAQAHIAFTTDYRIKEYFPENVIEAMNEKNRTVYRSNNPDLRPDAEFNFVDSETKDLKRGAIEVELTKKMVSRYKAKCKEYLNRSDIKVVVWLCIDESIRKNIKRSFDDEIRRYEGLFRFINFNDLVKNGLKKAKVVDVNNNELPDVLGGGRQSLNPDLLEIGL